MMFGVEVVGNRSRGSAEYLHSTTYYSTVLYVGPDWWIVPFSHVCVPGNVYTV